MHSEHFINTLKIAGNYVMWLPSKGILLFVWSVIPVIHAIASSFFVTFCWFLHKKNAIVSKILGYMGNLYKFSETVYYDCEVAYQIWRLHQFLFKYKIRKKRFSTPLEFNRKMVNLSGKTNTSIIVIKVSQQPIKYFNEYYKIMFPQW